MKNEEISLAMQPGRANERRNRVSCHAKVQNPCQFCTWHPMVQIVHGILDREVTKITSGEAQFCCRAISHPAARATLPTDLWAGFRPEW
jgi:hypothetical protein